MMGHAENSYISNYGLRYLKRQQNKRYDTSAPGNEILNPDWGKSGWELLLIVESPRNHYYYNRRLALSFYRLFLLQFPVTSWKNFSKSVPLISSSGIRCAIFLLFRRTSILICSSSFLEGSIALTSAGICPVKT